MPSSLQLAALQPLPVEQKAKENLSHLFVARLWAELCDCQGVRDFSKAAKLVVIGEVDLDSQLVNRDSASRPEPPHPIQFQALVHAVYMVVRSALTERVIGQVCGALQECISNVLVHRRMVRAVFVFLNSHFPTLIKRADTIAALQKNFPSFCSGK